MCFKLISKVVIYMYVRIHMSLYVIDVIKIQQ